MAFEVNGESVEVADLSESALMTAVSFVGARSHLFVGTLRDNLIMANPQATDEQLHHALRLAHIDDFVREQPAGLDMPIDPANLSGGQRQRIAVARALLHEAPIMIFDEATSSVDAESEALIMQTIHELAQSKTVIVVTHRLADTVNADMIAAFDHGSCVETGNYDTLMAAGGRYARMFHAQTTVEQVHRRAEGSGIRYAHTQNEVGGDSSKRVEEPAGKRNAALSGIDMNADDAMTTAQVIRRLLRKGGLIAPADGIGMLLRCARPLGGHVHAGVRHHGGVRDVRAPGVGALHWLGRDPDGGVCGDSRHHGLLRAVYEPQSGVPFARIVP